ncbi:MAG: cohesin domain-containing protein [Wenzhouxiangellaceae bacterium]
MNAFHKIASILGVTLALGLAAPVQAQFAGDLFFAEPSVAIPADGQGTLEVQVFAGAETFGAAQFELLFDPTRLEVVSVRPGDAPELQEVFSVRRENGRVAIIVANSGSLDVPFGTASLARVDVRPLAPAGSVIPIQTRVQGVLRQDTIPFASPGGLGGEVVVSAAGATPLGTASTRQADVSTVTAEPGSALHDRVTRLRPDGATVTLMTLDNAGQPQALPCLPRGPQRTNAHKK